MKLKNTFRDFLFFGGSITSDDWINFAPLPKVFPEDHKILSGLSEYLTGEHDKIIQKFRTTNEFLENTNINEIIKRGNERTSLREIHRVAYLVNKITEDSALVPKGFLALNYADNLIPTQGFANPWKELDSLENYCIFRKPSADSLNRYLALCDGEKKIDFLQTCLRKESEFTILKDALGVNFYVKSVVWPGFVNYFRANSNIMGHLYFGYGLKNGALAEILASKLPTQEVEGQTIYRSF